MAGQGRTLRRRLYEQLDVDAQPLSGVSRLNRIILALVIVSAAVAALETEPAVRLHPSHPAFSAMEGVFAVLFSVEFAARLWVKPESPGYAGPWGRLRYCLAWHALVDLVAVLALWADVLGAETAPLALLRLARLLRIFTLTRHGAFGIAARELWGAIRERSVELMLAFALAVLSVWVGAILLYTLEGRAQPEAFGSVPRAMWWSVVTLTTVGYGDVAPVTAGGKLVAAIVALTSIAVLALPAGILAAAFSDAFQRTRMRQEEVARLRRHPRSSEARD